MHYRDGVNKSYLLDAVRVLRRRETGAEKLAWQVLRNRNIKGLKFRRQHQIGSYIVDFYCNELKLIIELDGGIHLDPEQKEKDRHRDDYLRSSGFTVLRFPNNTVLQNIVGFITAIEAFTSQPPSPSGRGPG